MMEDLAIMAVPPLGVPATSGMAGALPLGV